MARRTLQSALLFAAIAVAASGCHGTHAQLREAAQEQSESRNLLHFVKNPDAAPELDLKDLAGKPITLADAKGKIVLLNFWATWCGPCRAEIPDLIDLQNKYKDQLEIIALATDEEDSDGVEKFVQHAHINYRVAMATNPIRVQYGGVPALPTSFVIDAQGRVVQKHVGLNDPTLYELEIRALLGLPFDGKVDYFEDTGQVFLKNAERATELPGVDLSKLDAEQKAVALRRFNSESCTCGCKMTLAQCRVNDTGCSVSKSITAKIVSDLAHSAAPKSPTDKQ